MVKIDPDEVYEIGDKTFKFAESLDPKKSFEQARLSDTTFGDLESTVGLVHVHGEARRVVEATLDGVKSDLSNFGQGLMKSVELLCLLEDVTVVSFQALHPYMPLAVDPDTGLNETSLANIGDIDGLDQGDDAREQAIAKREDNDG